MTWGEFKAHVEKMGVTDTMIMDYIDYAPHDKAQNLEDEDPIVFFNGQKYETDFYIM